MRLAAAAAAVAVAEGHSPVAAMPFWGRAAGGVTWGAAAVSRHRRYSWAAGLSLPPTHSEAVLCTSGESRLRTAAVHD